MKSLGSFLEKEEGSTLTGLFSGWEPVPLERVSVHVDVLDMAMKTTIKQRFRNMFQHAIEATYTFPIDSDAAISGFNASVAGRRIEGIVKTKEEAFEVYDQAIEHGNSAFLLDEEQPDIFTVSVGNMEPGEEAEIEISYVSQPDVYGEKVILTIPTSVSPRYAPENSDPVKVDRISPPVRFEVPYGLFIEVRIRQARDIARISSPSHKTGISLDEDDIIVSLHRSETALDRDFILEFEAERFAKPKAIISMHSNGKKAIMVNWIPDIYAEPRNEKEGVVFILDCSGSMTGSSITEAKKALNYCVQRLESETPFNIIIFGSTYRKLFETIMPCSDESRKKALQFIEKIDADMGGTRLIPALSAAYSMVGDLFCNFLLLTDGEIYNVDEAIHLAYQNRKSVRIFSFGIGYGPSHALINGIAKASGGGAVFISPDESIKEKVTRQFSRLGSPRITAIEVDWGGMDVTDVFYSHSSIFSGEPFTIFGLVERGQTEKVTMKGKVGEKMVQFVTSVVDIGEDDLIPTLWAKQHIKELEIGDYYQRGSQQLERKRKKVEREIEKTAMEFQLMSSRTSFVVVMEREEGKKNLDLPVFIRVPTQLTRGWHGMRMHAVEMFDHGVSMRIPIDRMRSRRLPFDEDLIWESKNVTCKKIDRKLYSERRTFITEPSPDKELELYNTLIKLRGQQGEFQWEDAFLERFFLQATPILKSFIDKIEGVEVRRRKTVLMTAFAVLILEKIKTVKGKRKHFLREASDWLERHAKNVKIDGKPVREILEIHLDFDDIFESLYGNN